MDSLCIYFETLALARFSWHKCLETLASARVCGFYAAWSSRYRTASLSDSPYLLP